MRHYLCGIGLLSTIVGYGQQNTVSAGGEASGSGGTVSYSIGQIDYQTFTGSSGTISQGVQQPFEIYSVGIAENAMEIEASLFPNPAVTSVTLSFESWESYPGTIYRLTDEKGSVIRSESIASNETSIDISNLPDACYYLQVLVSEQMVKNFKLVKNN